MGDPETLLGFLVQKFGRQELTNKGETVSVCKLSVKELTSFAAEFTIQAWADTKTAELVLVVQEDSQKEKGQDYAEEKRICKNSLH